VRMDVRRIESIKQGGQTVGNRTRVTIKKNKVAPPFRQAEFDIMYNRGISKEGDLLDLGSTMGVVEKRGAFYSFNNMRLGQGRENAKEFLEKSPEIAEQIEAAVREAAAMVPVQAIEVPDDAGEDQEEY
jgi:recombination protein RecA